MAFARSFCVASFMKLVKPRGVESVPEVVVMMSGESFLRQEESNSVAFPNKKPKEVAVISIFLGSSLFCTLS